MKENSEYRPNNFSPQGYERLLLNWSKNIKIYCYTIKNGQFKGVT